MQFEVNRRVATGLAFQANYTWAHDISNAQGDAPLGYAGETNYGLAVVDRFAFALNRGNVAGAHRQRFLLTGSYDLPFGKGRRWSSASHVLNGAFGGWSLNRVLNRFGGADSWGVGGGRLQNVLDIWLQYI
jgi:hypothetical protein